MESTNEYLETDLGNIAPNPKGEYNAETEYEYLDLVEYKGGSYLCVVALGTTVTGISPVTDKNTDTWQILTLPGSLTAEYIKMHDSVVNKSKDVENDRNDVEAMRQDVENVQADVDQMHKDVQVAAINVEENKEIVSGYAQSTEIARSAAEEAAENAKGYVQSFDQHVAEKENEAEETIENARIEAVKVVKNQEEESTQSLKQIEEDVKSAVQDAQGYATNASQSATSAANAASSASGAAYVATTAKDEAVTAKTAAETAKSGAESVLKSVKETATTATTNISNAKTQAIMDINEAGTTQKTAVDQAGTDQKANVEAEGTKQIDAMNDIKTKFDAASTAATKALEDKKTAATTAIENLSTEKTTAITTEGTTQKNAVTSAGAAKVKEIADEGAKQKQAIKEATDPFLTDIDALKRNNDRINAMLGILAYTDKVYSVDIPLWETTQGSTCIKSDDNAGLVALPSTAAEHRQNDYEDLPWFRTIDVNAIVDDNGIKRITAIKGDENFSESGSADVFVCGLAYYEKWSDLGNGYARYSRCFTPREGYELNKLALNLDGSKNPFFLIAKYPLVKGDDGLLHSQPNRRCAFKTSDSSTETISMNDSITHMKKRGKYYSLATFLDNGYIQTTWWLMFGDINSDKTMTGCTGYNSQFAASIESEELHTYFPATNSQANNIEVGSYVSIGHEYVSGSNKTTDRYYKRIHEIAFDAKVLKIETLDDNNEAIYVDCDPFSTAHQTSGDYQLRCYLSTMHWRTGFSKNVKGRTGSPCQTTDGLTNRRYPYVFQGIEMQLGVYEIMAGFDIITDTNGTQEIYGLLDATKATTGPKQNQAGYLKLSTITPTTKAKWNYITKFAFTKGYICATNCGESGSGSSKGVGDAIYISGSGTGSTMELRSFGGLENWVPCGLLCLHLNYWLGGCGWDIGGRLSVNAVLQEG